MTTHGSAPRPDAAPSLRALMRRGDALARTPAAERDTRWHAEAAQLGDFPALVLALVRAERRAV